MSHVMRNDERARRSTSIASYRTEIQLQRRLGEMATLVKLNAAKCPSCRIVLLRPIPGSQPCQMLCPACGYHTAHDQQCPKLPRPPTLMLPTVEVTDTSSENQAIPNIGNFPATSTFSISGTPPHGLYRRQDSREHQSAPTDVANSAVSSCSSSTNSSPIHPMPSSWLPLPPVAAFPLGMGSIRRHSYQLLEGGSASTPSR